MSGNWRFKLLLDEMMPRRERFPHLNNFHDLKHIVHDMKKPGIKDSQVIMMAKRNGRILLTKNVKHFIGSCGDKKVDLIGVGDLVGFEEIDRKVSAYLRKRKTRKMTGIFQNIVQSSRRQ